MTVTKTKEPQYNYNAAEDEVYQQALKNLESVKGNAPVLAGTYDEKVQSLYDQVMNRKNFSYDLNGDALWQQYKDQYSTQGKMAMMDTMGQASALTGGYGSSYAQSAGQQAYQGYLQQLNDRVPELYQLALNKYNNDQALLQDQFSAARQMQADEYGKYQDALAQHNANIDRAQAAADTAYDRGNNAWLTGEQLRRQDDETTYSRQQDSYNKLASLISSTGYKPTQAELLAAGMSAEQAAAYQKAYKNSKKSSSSGVYGGNGGGGTGDGNAHIEDLVNEMVKTGTVSIGKTVNKSTREGQQELKSAVNKEINNAVKYGGISAKEAQELKKKYRGYTM